MHLPDTNNTFNVIPIILVDYLMISFQNGTISNFKEFRRFGNVSLVNDKNGIKIETFVVISKIQVRYCIICINNYYK